MWIRSARSRLGYMEAMSYQYCTVPPNMAMPALRKSRASLSIPRHADRRSKMTTPTQESRMAKLDVQAFSVSIDGYGAGPDQSLEGHGTILANTLTTRVCSMRPNDPLKGRGALCRVPLETFVRQ